MINVSSTIKTACKSASNRHIEYVLVGTSPTPIYISADMSATAFKDKSFFGTFNGKILSFTAPNNVDYKKQTLQYFIKINGENFKIGSFIVTDVKDSDTTEEVKVTAQDYSLYFAIPYTSELDYSSGTITLFQVLQECCTNAGVTLSNASIENGSFIVDSNQFVNNEMIGDVVSAIAGMSGNFATIDENDNLKLLFTTETNILIDDYVELDDKRDTQPITSVSIGTSQVEGQEAILRDLDLIAQYGEHWLILNDNPFAYTLAKRQELVTAIFNKVKGFGYSSFKSDFAYIPYSQLGDLVRFKNKAGTLVGSIVLKIDKKGVDFKLSAPSITSATINYKTAPKPEEIAKRAEIIANQSTAQIISITQNINNINEDLNDTYTKEQTNILVQTAENGLTNTLKNTGGNNYWYNTYFSEYENNALTYWNGNISVINESSSATKTAGLLPNGEVFQTITLKNGTYTNKFKFKKLISTANCQVLYNNRIISLTGNVGEENVIETTGDITTGSITIKFICDTNGGFEFYELMLNNGTEASVYTQNINETVTDTVKIGMGVQVENSAINSYTRQDADGFRGFNKKTNEVTFYQTEDGLYGKKLRTESIQSGNLIVTTRRKHNYISGI